MTTDRNFSSNSASQKTCSASSLTDKCSYLYLSTKNTATTLMVNSAAYTQFESIHTQHGFTSCQARIYKQDFPQNSSRLGLQMIYISNPFSGPFHARASMNVLALRRIAVIFSVQATQTAENHTIF